MLLTRSPLGLHRCCHRMDLVRLACVKHAASVRPEPGSNSPSRSQRLRRAAEIGESAPRERVPEGPTGTQHGRCPYLSALTLLLCSHTRRRDCPHWFLAISVPFSRSARGTGIRISQRGRGPMCLLARVTARAPHFLCTLRGGYRLQSSRSVYERPHERVNRGVEPAGRRTDCPRRPTARVGHRPCPHRVRPSAFARAREVAACRRRR